MMYKSFVDAIDAWIIMDVKEKIELVKAVAICTFVVGYMLWLWFEDAPIEEHDDYAS